MPPSPPPVDPEVEKILDKRPKKGIRRKLRSKKTTEAANTEPSRAMSEAQSEHGGLEETVNTQIPAAEAAAIGPSRAMTASIEPSRAITETQSEHGGLGENHDAQVSTTEAANIVPSGAMIETQDEHDGLGEILDTQTSTTEVANIHPVHSSLSSLQEQLAQKNRELETLRAEKFKESTRKSNLDRTVSKQKAEIVELKTENSALKNRLDGKVNELNEQLDQREADYSELQKEFNARGAAFAVAVDSLEEAKKVNDEKDKQILSVENALENSQTTCKLFEDRVKELKGKLEKEKKLKEDLKEDHQKVDEQTATKIDNANRKAAKDRNEIKSLQRQLKTAENFFQLPDGTLKDTKEHIQELENAKNHFKECGDGLQGDIDKLNEVLDAKNSQIDEQDIKIHEISKELKSIKRQATTATRMIGVQTDPVPLTLVDDNKAAESTASTAATATTSIGIQPDPVPLALIKNDNAAENITPTATITTTTIGVQTDPVHVTLVQPTGKWPSWLMYLQENPIFQLLGLLLIAFLLGTLLSTSPQQGWDAHQVANSKAVRLGAHITSGYARQVMGKTPSASWMAPEDVMKIAAALKGGLGEGASGLY